MPRYPHIRMYIGSLISARWFVCAFVAGLVVMVCGTQSANSSCGDYLQMNAQHQSSHETLERSETTISNEVTRPSEQRPTTCNGPQCRSNPATPSLPVPNSTSSTPTEQATVAVKTSFEASHRCSGTIEELAAHSLRGLPIDLLRPPQS